MKLVITTIALVALTQTAAAADVSGSPSPHHAVAATVTTAASANATRLASSQAMKADKIVVYSASWCGPCRKLKPILASLKKEGHEVEYLDVDRDAAKLKYHHKAVPTIYFLKGETVIKQETGYRSKDQIKRMLISKGDNIEAKRRPSAKTADTASNLTSRKVRS